MTMMQQHTCTLAILIDPVLFGLSLIDRAPSLYSGNSSIRMVSDDGQPMSCLANSGCVYTDRGYTFHSSCDKPRSQTTCTVDTILVVAVTYVTRLSNLRLTTRECVVTSGHVTKI